jgi:hypothetical protein
MKRWELNSRRFNSMRIIVKDMVVAIIEDIIIPATVTATITTTEIRLIPEPNLVTEVEGPS